MRYSFLFVAVGCALTLSQAAAALPEPTLHVAKTEVQSTTAANASPEYVALEKRVQTHLQDMLRGNAQALTRTQLESAQQQSPQADTAWLKAADYDFQKNAREQDSIKLLSAFNLLTPTLLRQNRATVERINQDASDALRQKALIDAENIRYFYALAEALGPRLGNAFIDVYQRGEMGKAAALIKASAVSTSPAKQFYHYPRPFKQPGNAIHLVPDTAVVNDSVPYTASGDAFPSGHTNSGYNDALLLAEMLPERFVPLIDRAATYGYSRVVLGVHYPLDVMGGRMTAENQIATLMNDPEYKKLFTEAKAQMRTALEQACGMSLAKCAQPQGKDDPYTQPAMRQFYRFTMSYGLPAAKVAARPVSVPKGAEVLLEGPLPELSAEQRRALMVKTAEADGYPLSGSSEGNFWQRLNLHDAVVASKQR
ncbi:acid phosphatase [Lonsdalea quercina]|uniref:acid phosphatase n=1 Tax=Lonsdalea quercina TaxID=71657 RepID=UPI0039767D1B